VLLYYPNDLAAARADVKNLWLQPGGEVIPERATKA
jgi:glutathione transport system substrate-binding protein